MADGPREIAQWLSLPAKLLEHLPAKLLYGRRSPRNYSTADALQENAVAFAGLLVRETSLECRSVAAVT